MRSRRQIKWIHTSRVVGCRLGHWWTTCSPMTAGPWTTTVKSALENLLHSATYRNTCLRAGLRHKGPVAGLRHRKTCLGASLRHKGRVDLLGDAWARRYDSSYGHFAAANSWIVPSCWVSWRQPRTASRQWWVSTITHHWPVGLCTLLRTYDNLPVVKEQPPFGNIYSTKLQNGKLVIHYAEV